MLLLSLLGGKIDSNVYAVLAREPHLQQKKPLFDIDVCWAEVCVAARWLLWITANVKNKPQLGDHMIPNAPLFSMILKFNFILFYFFFTFWLVLFSLSLIFYFIFFSYILYIAAARLSCKNIDDLSVAEHVPDFPFILTIHVWRLLMLLLRLLSSLLLLYFTIITKVFPNFFYFIFFGCSFFGCSFLVRFCVQVQIQSRTKRRQKKTDKWLSDNVDHTHIGDGGDWWKTLSCLKFLFRYIFPPLGNFLLCISLPNFSVFLTRGNCFSFIGASAQVWIPYHS